MKNKYKSYYYVPPHVVGYVKGELKDYKSNLARFKALKDNTRELLIIKKRLNSIEKVLNNLDDIDRDTVEKIFFEQLKPRKCKEYGISQDVYYYTRKKVIYLIAYELELI